MRTDILGAIIGVVLVSFGLWGCPRYEIYRSRMEGRAELAKAEGIAQANNVVAASLKNNPELLQYFSIRNIGISHSAIYVPTEANIPITEAGKTKAPPKAGP